MKSRQIILDNISKQTGALRSLRTTTLAGQAWVSEALQKIDSIQTLSHAKMLLESASKMHDTKLDAWVAMTKSQLETDSIYGKAIMCMEALEAADSPNKELAATAISDAASNSASNESLAIKIANGCLSQFDMYPEVAALIVQAKQEVAAYAKLGKIDTATQLSKFTYLIGVISADMLGLPLDGRWHVADEKGKLAYAPIDANSDDTLLLNALRNFAKFDDVNKRFIIDTVLGPVEICAEDSIMYNGNVLNVDAFAEHAKQYLQLHQTQLEYENVSYNDALNAVALIASNMQKIQVFENSIVDTANQVAVLKLNEYYNVIRLNDIAYASSVKELGSMVSYELQQAAELKWKDDMQVELAKSLRQNALLQAYNDTLNEVKVRLSTIKDAQSKMTNDSEGFAAYQIIIDQYNALIAKIESKISEIVAA